MFFVEISNMFLFSTVA